MTNEKISTVRAKDTQRIRLVVQVYEPETKRYRNLATGRFDLAPELDPKAVGDAILASAPSAADLMGL